MPETTKYLDLHGVQTLAACIENAYKTQVAELPAASESLLGKIYQYTGATTASLTHGCIYECVSDGADPATYSWVQTGFDTTPTQGSKNAVTSDGIYKRTPFARSTVGNSAILGYGSVITGGGVENSIIAANASRITSRNCAAIGGSSLLADTPNLTAIGTANRPRAGDLFNIGNGSDYQHRSNIVEVTSTSANVNGDIQINGVNIPTPYTTMPTITADMLGKIAMYVGATGGGFTQGCFYIAATDGAAEPTYSWVRIGSGYSETVLWENTGETNPDTITLSEAYTGFDALAIRVRFGSDNDTHTSLLSTSLLTVGWNELLWGVGSGIVGNYIITSTSVFTKNAVTGAYIINKIIGIKY